jgi:hypothetical protein
VATVAALFIVGGLACAHLLPDRNSAQHLSNWRPLLGPIDHPTLGLGSVLEILWPAAALGYLARIAAPPESRRMVAWAGGAALAFVIFAFDWPERSVPIATALLMGTTWTVFGSIFAPSTAVAASPGEMERRIATPLIHRLAITFAVMIAGLSFSADSPAQSGGARLLVGPQHAIKSPSAAAGFARDGDIVEIEAGLYAGDAAVWKQNELTIRGVGGRPHLRADGAHAEGKAIWVIKGRNTTIENIEFSGAKVADRNGAGIRLEGAGVTIRGCHFHHNENGILAAPHADSDIVIEQSEFNHNGFGDGQSHNLYIGTVRSFTLRHSYVHHAIAGHNVKSRAWTNLIEHNRIMDERDGRSSYAIDLPNGGLSHVIGNVLHQGPMNLNKRIVAYGAEGYRNPLRRLLFIDNTIVNDDPSGAEFLFVRAGAETIHVEGNIFSGPGRHPAGNNFRVSKSAFVDPGKFDFRLKNAALAQ